MAKEFNTFQPIYLQLLDHFHEQIANGNWKVGSRIESVRNLALEYGVNPNTIQRALAELEREGVCYTERTSGRFITEDKQMVRKLRQSIVRSEAVSFIKRAKALHLEKDEIKQVIDTLWEKEIDVESDVESGEKEKQ